MRLKVKGQWYTVEIERKGPGQLKVLVNGEPFEVEVEGPRSGAPSRARPSAPVPGLAAQIRDNTIIAPMNGRIVDVLVQEGQEVAPGTEVCILEAMKMEQTISTARRGVISKIYVSPGQSVSLGEALLKLEEV